LSLEVYERGPFTFPCPGRRRARACQRRARCRQWGRPPGTSGAKATVENDEQVKQGTSYVLESDWGPGITQPASDLLPLPGKPVCLLPRFQRAEVYPESGESWR